MQDDQPQLIVRPARRADIEVFCAETGSDRAASPTLRAWVGEIARPEGGTRIVAIGGISVCRGRWFGFIDLADEARAYPITVARAMRRFLEQARAWGVRYIYAEPALDEPGAAWRLKRLGFIIDPRSQLVYRWSAAP